MHYFDPRYQEFTFVNTVYEIKEGFTEIQIKGTEAARALYTSLIYPSAKDDKWVIISNQIKNFPVTVQEIDIAQKVRGNNIATLKGKNTQRNPSIVERDQVNIPLGLIKLHKEVFFTRDIFFENSTPFFLTLSHKIYFTSVNHLANDTVPETPKYFKEVCQYYLQRGFRTTTLNASGEFGPLKSLIESLPGGPLVDMASAN